MLMNGSYLLDTNIVIGLFANDAQVIQRLETASRVAIPAIVMGELYYGAYKSRDQHFESIKEIMIENW